MKRLHSIVIRVTFLLGLALFILPISAQAAPASGQIPLDSGVYLSLDKLVGSGLIDSSLSGSRPYTRLEAARQIKEALQRAERSPVPIAISELLQQLKNEFYDQLVELHALSGDAPDSYICLLYTSDAADE